MENTTITIELKANDWKQEGDRKSKAMFLRIGDFEAKIINEGKKEVGSICGCVGGALVFKLVDEKGIEFEHYTSLQTLWNTYVESIEKTDYKLS